MLGITLKKLLVLNAPDNNIDNSRLMFFTRNSEKPLYYLSVLGNEIWIRWYDYSGDVNGLSAGCVRKLVDNLDDEVDYVFKDTEKEYLRYRVLDMVTDGGKNPRILIPLEVIS